MEHNDLDGHSVAKIWDLPLHTVRRNENNEVKQHLAENVIDPLAIVSYLLHQVPASEMEEALYFHEINFWLRQ